MRARVCGDCQDLCSLPQQPPGEKESCELKPAAQQTLLQQQTLACKAPVLHPCLAAGTPALGPAPLAPCLGLQCRFARAPLPDCTLNCYKECCGALWSDTCLGLPGGGGRLGAFKTGTFMAGIPLGLSASPVEPPFAPMQLIHASALACTGSAGWALVTCAPVQPASPCRHPSAVPPVGVLCSSPPSQAFLCCAPLLQDKCRA